MASSKKTKEEKETKKSKGKAKETKHTKPETKKKANPSPKIPKKKKNSKIGIQNGTVSESEDEVVITTPATSNDNGSQEESETEQDSRSQEAKKPNKSGKKMQQDDDEEEEDSKICNFPMRRVKRIFKTQSSDFAITGEAVFLVNKATDKFLEQFCEDAYECCVKDRKKSLAYKHLASAVSKQRRYDFLSDFVPEKIKAEDALAQRKLAEEGKNRTLETQ